LIEEIGGKLRQAAYRRKAREAAAQNRQGRARLGALQVARSLLMRKPNYRFERAERDRAKKARNDKKLQRQQERAVTRTDVGTPEPTAENKPRET
jgi:hypothetical protein